MNGVAEVCPACDIADCTHIRAAQRAAWQSAQQRGYDTQRWPKDSIAEIDRLRRALEKIANCGQGSEPNHWKFRQMARTVALAALSKTDAAN